MDYAQVSAAFAAAADAKRAQGMAHYMRDQFAFFGLSAARRRELARPWLRAAKHAEQVDWSFIDQCWAAPQRELQYLACDYLVLVTPLLTPADWPRLAHLICTKSWWDTVDILIKPVGALVARFPELRRAVLAWSRADNFWLRRAAIEHQLLRKQATDEALLAQIIENNLAVPEFFVQKAIGWALRDYAKTKPAWVMAFLQTHQAAMSALAVREASKHLPPEWRQA
ncbi:DNA alkylation repair protein [Limosilactobacillus ingluviei]|uniref:DNA-7-methylguanine glycosylase n=1 Tax=Limosilactobacillus ingluviei DSM 15946 TaxID=1423760 RepID=A0A0R1UR05_9LACO|nr:DNA alkylation repair protein [Limosilactobacillus ingluviei]KRL92283.1 DNA-7-methylguanine glycosylase [Limosilactobacillus ingluviei DSM 15946]